MSFFSMQSAVRAECGPGGAYFDNGMLGSAQTRQGLCPCTLPSFEKGGPKLF